MVRKPRLSVAQRADTPVHELTEAFEDRVPFSRF
jgi:hypothetical protein